MRLIDADKVNKTIDKFIGYLDEDMILRIKMKILAIPTVERLQGEWRVHSHCSDGFSYKCSLCGRVINQGYWFEQNEILSVYPYCHCGAKMIAVENPFKWYFSLGKSDDVTDMKHIKVGNTIYTQDDDKQGWTGREENK